MRTALILAALAALVAIPLVGCAAASPSAPDEDPTATDAEGLKRKPVPFVLQYVGEYKGDGKGSIDSLVLDRAGNWEGRIAGEERSGRFYGPRRPATPLTLTFVTRGERFSGEVGSWGEHSTIVITRGGKAESVVSPWLSGDEAMCDATHGHWFDDDVDKETGLFCTCDAPKSFIPSLGGCVD